MFGFGSNKYGEIGIGKVSETCPEPEQVEFDGAEYSISKIEAGGRHSMILLRSGQLLAFGFGAHGQLGTKVSDNLEKPG